VSASDLLDVGTFAERVLRRPLFEHQLDLARSPARYRVVCAGRQSGKSVTLSTIALHEAATRRNVLVLLVSAGEAASRRLLADIADAATSSPLLSGSVLDEHKGELALSNGSRIVSVPASQRQIRGWPVDVLILDESGFIDPDIWRAAEPAIIARPGSRVILASSPWGTVDHFFRALWQRGSDAPDEHVASWHWPSSISPLVDAEQLERIREREPADYYAREYLAEWPDESGAYFTEAELMAATASYRLTDPATLAPARRFPCVGGVDWGVARDANALVVASVLDPEAALDSRWRVFLPWLEAHSGTTWAWWIDRLAIVAGSLRPRVLASERNGVGAMPTETLQDELLRRRIPVNVQPIWTDARRKQAGFGKIKLLLQSDRLVLPRHPALLKELRGLTFEQQAGGTLRIEVPSNLGHDDLAMSLMQALSCVETRYLRDGNGDPHGPALDLDTVATGAGVPVPRRPAPIESSRWIDYPAGEETGDGW